jgi:hypothetical protein
MRLAAIGIALGLVTAPAGAQSGPNAPVPRPARLLWEQAPVEPFIQDTLPRATTGAGTATYVGAGSSCSGLPYLAGLVAGGVLGAMVGSAFEGDQTPEPPKSP